jgi:hypothetical protein
LYITLCGHHQLATLLETLYILGRGTLYPGNTFFPEWNSAMTLVEAFRRFDQFGSFVSPKRSLLSEAQNDMERK